MIDRTLGHYHILEKIGAGGMGEVYRARDTKLNRHVAIKILPAAFTSDSERVARFKREAQLLASLNHPNIAAIYDLEESDGVRYLVLELVPGETLAGRLAGGPLGLDEALRICCQIAEALEAAHEKGIIHRDIKPANIKVTPEGKVKVLDFGLAKVFAGDISVLDVSTLPDLNFAGTCDGVILGSPAYMSPEQVRGKALDKRTDIWSFGCVLYETLAGRQVFPGETMSDLIAGILHYDPEWEALPKSVPERVRGLLRRCLQKDRQRRLRDIGDARLELEDILATPAAGGSTSAGISGGVGYAVRSHAVLWIVAGLLAGALGTAAVVWQVNPRSTSPPMRFSAVTNFAGVESQPALSPDGRSVVFVSDRGGRFDIWLGLVTGGSLVRITNDGNLKARPRERTRIFPRRQPHRVFHQSQGR